ncbi:LOW QUALITY PROTEIN: arfaptin-1-like [Hipposideros larvatus]
MDFPFYSEDKEWSNSLLASFETTEDAVYEGECCQDCLISPQKCGLITIEKEMKNPMIEKFKLVRKWSLNKYKCTRQLMSEKLGHSSRTVNLELDYQIDVLKDNKKKYEHILRLAQMFSSHLSHMVHIQKELGNAFADLSLKSLDLHKDFGQNVDTQRLMAKNGEILCVAINSFIENVNTLVNKTIKDTLLTVKQYESARIEYDAYRTDLQEQDDGNLGPYSLTKIEQSKLLFQTYKEKYEQMRNDVAIKLKFLEENKVKVLRNQLALFHDAISAYSTGNQSQLEETLAQFHIMKTPGEKSISWFEEHQLQQKKK